MMRALALGLAIVVVATASVSAADVKLSVVPLGYDPDVEAGAGGPISVLAVKPYTAQPPDFYGTAIVRYAVYAEVVGGTAGVAFFSVDVQTEAVLSQPVIGPNGAGDFADVVKSNFDIFGPNEGWPIDDDVWQVSSCQNVFGNNPASPGDPCDPGTLAIDVGVGGPVEIFRGEVDLGTGATYPQAVTLDAATAMAMLWRSDNANELCAGGVGFVGYPTAEPPDSVAVNVGFVISGEAKAFDQDEKGCVTTFDFNSGLANCFQVSQFGLPFQEFMKCELHDHDADGVISRNDFNAGLANAFQVDQFTGCTEP